jgi:hypothetical protein
MAMSSSAKSIRLGASLCGGGVRALDEITAIRGSGDEIVIP